MKRVKCAVDEYSLAIGRYNCQLRRWSAHAVAAPCYGVLMNRDKWVKPRKLFTFCTGLYWISYFTIDVNFWIALFCSDMLLVILVHFAT